MIVVDTSAIIAALAVDPDSALAERLRSDGALQSPHLIDVEVMHVLRAFERGRVLSLERIEGARADFADLAITRYPHEPLADRIWALRKNITAYDAAFVSLAEALGVPLVTCDAKLRRAPGHSATVQVYA